jgi:predicted mannosyl-3-phosphoglycerate phosphatase (HAD superfamily)
MVSGRAGSAALRLTRLPLSQVARPEQHEIAEVLALSRSEEEDIAKWTAVVKDSRIKFER